MLALLTYDGERVARIRVYSSPVHFWQEYDRSDILRITVSAEKPQALEADTAFIPHDLDRAGLVLSFDGEWLTWSEFKASRKQDR